MQALHTRLERPHTSAPHKGFSVHGLNAPLQGDSSFRKMLQTEIFTQEFKAKEGPPDRSFYSASGMRRDGSQPSAETEMTARTVSPQETQNASKMPVQTESTQPAAEREADTAKNGFEESVPIGGDSAHKTVQEEPAAAVPETEDAKSIKSTADNTEDNTELLQNVSGAEMLFVQDVPAVSEEPVQKTDSVSGAAEKTHKTALYKKAGIFSGSNETSDDSTSTDPDALYAQVAAAASYPLTAAESDTTASGKGKAKPSAVKEVQLPVQTEPGSVSAASDQAEVLPDMRGVPLGEIPAITVHDERTENIPDEKRGLLSSAHFDGKGNVQADVYLTGTEASKTPADSFFTPKDAAFTAQFQAKEQKTPAFASLLSNEIRNNAADLVKTGSIILRDGNRGSINLILHPEQLGNVKIRLQISDNILTGRITVASEEAYHAFKANIGALTEAFASNGFDTANFDLSWSGQPGGNTDGRGANGQEMPRNPFAGRYDAQNPEIGAETAEYGSAELRPYVNLIA